MKKAILLSIAGILLTYLAISFYILEINPVMWSKPHRAILILAGLFTAFLTVSYEMIVGFKKD